MLLAVIIAASWLAVSVVAGLLIGRALGALGEGGSDA